MKKRNAELVTMAESAGLKVMSMHEKGGRVYAHCVAPNGVERPFSIVASKPSDVRGDMNEHALMKRFARQNPAPYKKPEPIAESEMTTAQTTPAQPEAPQAVTYTTLAPRDFYRLCEWLKGQKMANIPSFDALHMLAAREIGESMLSPAELREAMDVTGTQEPASWKLPADPALLVAYELVAFMKRLGEIPPESLVLLLKKAHAVT